MKRSEKSDSRETYDVPDKATRIPINRAGLEGQRTAVATFVRHDRRNKTAIVALSCCLAGMTALCAYTVTMQKVFVYQLSETPLGKETYTLLDAGLTFNEANLLDEARDWVKNLRTVTLDPIYNDRLRSYAQARAIGPVEERWEELTTASAMPDGWTRSIDDDSFKASEGSKGEQGYFSWSLQWVEKDWWGSVLREERAMFVNVNMVVLPVSAMGRTKGNLDGIYVAYADISVVQPNSKRVASRVTEWVR